jgi:hypothetical protein
MNSIDDFVNELERGEILETKNPYIPYFKNNEDIDKLNINIVDIVYYDEHLIELKLNNHSCPAHTIDRKIDIETNAVKQPTYLSICESNCILLNWITN